MKEIDNLAETLRIIPGVGLKTATRYSYDILELDVEKRKEIIEDIKNLNKIKNCQRCYGYTTETICHYCQEKRDENTLLVVAKPKDINKIEKIIPEKYYYYSLGGVIDPLNGIKINDLHIDALEKRIASEKIQEIILVFPTNNEGELTASYLKKRFEKYNVKFTKLAQGVPIGGELEYLDELTLLKSIEKRQDY